MKYFTWDAVKDYNPVKRREKHLKEIYKQQTTLNDLKNLYVKINK